MHRHFAAALVVLLAGAAPAAPKLRPKPEADLWFPTKIGTTWVYQSGDSRRVEIITAAESRSDGALVTVSRDGAVKRWRADVRPAPDPGSRLPPALPGA